MTFTRTDPNKAPPIPFVPLPDPNKLPAELRGYDAWIVWRCDEWRWSNTEKKWKLGKPPTDRHTGYTRDMNDRANQSGLADALIDVTKLRKERGTHYGVGPVFNEKTPFFCPDLDDDIISGQPSQRLQWMYKEHPSWGEASISAEGAHVFYRGRYDNARGKNFKWRGSKVELFGSVGFIAMTGNMLDASISELADGTELLATILKEAEKEPEKKADPPQQKQQTSQSASEFDVIGRMFNSSKAGEIRRLWAGGGDDASADDMSLVNHIAFWAGPDEQLIDRVFRASQRMRDKWCAKHKGEGSTYGSMTIRKVLASKTEFYSPGPNVNWGNQGGQASGSQSSPQQQQTGKTDPPKDETPPDNPLVSGAMSNTQFHAADIKHEWHIDSLFVKDEPLVVVAASKSMKTAIVVDGAVSMAAGKPFLGTFPVRTPTPVYIISAESGAASLQARMRTVCKAKGIDPNGLPIYWYTRVELLSTLEGCANLEAAIIHFGCKVVVLDPSYLSLGGAVTNDNAGNMFAMGALLAAVGAVCQRAGATCIVVTHANGRLEVGKPMELHHIAWSGFQQWARQWWLISRIEPYSDDGKHALYLRYGGSAGHTGLLVVGIDEGTFDPSGGGKKWDVVAVDAQAARRAEQEDKAKEEQSELEKNADAVLKAMIAIIGDDAEVATQNAIQDHTDLKRPAIKAGVKKLVGDGAVIEAIGVVKCGTGSRKFKGIRRPDSWTA